MTKKQDDLPYIPDFQGCDHISEEDYQKLMPDIRIFRLGNGKCLREREINGLLEEARHRLSPPKWWDDLPKDLQKTLKNAFRTLKKMEKTA